MRNDVLQVLQSTPEQIAQGELEYLKDLIQEHNLASKVNPTTIMHNDDVLKATLGSVEEGLLTASEGFEAIQQLSKPTPIQGTEFEQDVLNFKVNLHLCHQSTLQTNTFGIQMHYNQFTGMLDVYVKTNY